MLPQNEAQRIACFQEIRSCFLDARGKIAELLKHGNSAKLEAALALLPVLWDLVFDGEDELEDLGANDS